MIFNQEQREKAEFIQNSEWSKLSNLLSHEIKELAIVWSYYSGRIEGNTYTFVETDLLLKDNITARHSYEEAVMLKNLYNTFISEVWYINKEHKTVEINKSLLFRLHSQITAGLLPNDRRGALRDVPVKITGTQYLPSGDPMFIQQKFDEILEEQKSMINPLEKAVYLHCNLSRLQPFVDGNKRLSRAVESVVLMNSDIIPVYSSIQEDFINYKTALIHFYENEDYSLYSDYILNKQINRIQSITSSMGKDTSLPEQSKTSDIVKQCKERFGSNWNKTAKNTSIPSSSLKKGHRF